MMSKELIALSTLFACAAFCVALTPASAEGVLAASSGATVDAGFPVITGPASSVLTPTGAELTDPLPNMKVPDVLAAPPPPKVQVKNYSWPKAGTRLARGASVTKTSTRILSGAYNTVNAYGIREYTY